MMSPFNDSAHHQWDVDERLVAPESRFEVEDGRVVYVPPSDEPHGSRHSKLSALLEAHVSEEYNVASDMLTRTSMVDDIAPDASVYPFARHPVSGGRQLEELAFEVVSTERLSHAGKKALKLVTRGVRRVFAIDVERGRGCEWNHSLATWEILAESAVIEDRCFVTPLPIAALLSAAKSDDAVASALLAKRNAVLVQALEESHALGELAGISAGKAEGILAGKAEGILAGKADAMSEAVLAVLDARGILLSSADRDRIAQTRDFTCLSRWLVRAVTCTAISELE
jgi:Uma2 family endonuclease